MMTVQTFSYEPPRPLAQFDGLEYFLSMIVEGRSGETDANLVVMFAGHHVVATLDEPEDQRVKKDILWRVTETPGLDARDVARTLGIPGLQAVTLVQEMLRDGILDLDG